MSENHAAPQNPALLRLTPADIALDAPLPWPLHGENGALLFEAGTVVPDEALRAFLFAQFQLHRMADQADDERQSPGETPKDDPRNEPLTLDDIGLTIGGRIGLRSAIHASAPMHASRVIGFSAPRRNNERSLFITQPVLAGSGLLELVRDEYMELVALTGKGVFRFTCMVDAINREPFNYVVLSASGAITRLRERKFTRMPTCLAARFAPEGAPDEQMQLARISDISPYGMSLTVHAPVVQLGDRLRLRFRFTTDGTDVQVDTLAVTRHVGKVNPDTQVIAYGLEFEALEPSQRIALKAFMAENG